MVVKRVHALPSSPEPAPSCGAISARTTVAKALEQASYPAEWKGASAASKSRASLTS